MCAYGRDWLPWTMSSTHMLLTLVGPHKWGRTKKKPGGGHCCRTQNEILMPSVQNSGPLLLSSSDRLLYCLFAMNLMRLKVFFHAAEGEQIRRFSVQKESKLEAIKDRLNEMSGMDNGYQIHYVDPDGDQVLISSQEEWEECLNVLGDPLTLRLHVSEVQRSGKAMPCRRESDSADRGSWWQLKTFADAFDARGKQIPVDMMHTCAVQLMDDGYYHEALQTLQSCEVAGAVGLYNMACCYALMWQQDEAIATLKKSIAKGYKDWEHMQSDEDLASLHSVAQFQQMVQDLKEGKQPTAIPETQVCSAFLH